MIATVKFALIVLALALLALIVLAAGQEPIGTGFSRLVDDPWGIVTLFDLYAGFAVIGVVMYAIEDKPVGRLLAIAPLPLLGNLWAALWLAFRLTRLLRDLSRRTNGGR